MRYLLYDLGQDPAGKDLPFMHQALNNVLAEEMRAGRRLVLVLDEAQNLSEEALEFVRLLSNFETPWMKLLQIVIAGQPQLSKLLARPAHGTASPTDFVFHPAGAVHPRGNFGLHRPSAVGGRIRRPQYIHVRRSSSGLRSSAAGIPRNINNLCFHAMSLACAAEKKQVDSKMIREVAADSAAGSSIEHFPVAPRPPNPTAFLSRRPLPSPPG